jgi:hypothetical protein
MDEELLIPASVRVQNGRLYWKAYAIEVTGRSVLRGRRKTNYRVDGAPQMVKPPGRLLTSFAQLFKCGEDEIASFAARNGVLGICEHNLPRTHSTDWRAVAGFHAGGASCRQLRWTGARRTYTGAWEPIQAWRRYSEEASLLINLGIRLQTGGVVSSPEDPLGLLGLRRHELGDAHAQRQFLAARVNEWLALGAVRPRLDWGFVWPDEAEYLALHPEANGISMKERQPTIRFGNRAMDLSGSEGRRAATLGWCQGTTLFGALAWQMALTVACAAGPVTCSSCGDLYSPRRRPAEGRSRYCPSCGRAAANRAAQERFRSKMQNRKGSVGTGVELADEGGRRREDLNCG